MEVLEQVQAILADEGVPSTINVDGLSTSIQAGILGCELKVIRKMDFLNCIILVPLFAPEHRRTQMCEAICRANFGLKFGRWDFDPSDSQLVFYASLPMRKDEPSHDQLRCLVLFSWHMVHVYALALVEVGTSDTTPEVAVDKAEALAQPQIDHSAVN